MDRFTEGTVHQNTDSTFTIEGVFDDIVFKFDIDSINIDCTAWNDIQNRGKHPSRDNLDEIRDLFNNFILDPDIELFQDLADIFDDILNDGFRFDNNAEVMFGD